MAGVSRLRRAMMYATFGWLLLAMAFLVYEIGRVILDLPTISTKTIGMLGVIWGPIMLALFIYAFRPFSPPTGNPNEPTNSDS